MVGDEPDKKSSGDEGAGEEERDVLAHCPIAEGRKENEDAAECEKCVHMKERHRSIQRELDPKGERTVAAVVYRGGGVSDPGYSAAPEQFFAPMPKQKQSSWNGVKQTPLRDEHRQRDTFPSNGADSLIVREFTKGGSIEEIQYLKAGDSAVEQKTGYAKGAAPPIERIKSGERSQQSSPNQTVDKIDMEQIKQRVKQVCSRRISQCATDIDRVVGPKGNSTREILNVGNVQRQIAKVIGRLDF